MGDEGKTMLADVESKLGIPKDTFHWPWPRKVLGKPDGKGPAKGAPKNASNKSYKPSKSGKSRGGTKRKKPVSGGWY